jgi:hypothetical protein
MKKTILIFVFINLILVIYSADNSADTVEKKLLAKYNSTMGSIEKVEKKYSFFYSFVKTKLLMHQENETLSRDEIYKRLFDVIDSQTVDMIIVSSEKIKLNEKFAGLYDLILKNENDTNFGYQHDADKKRLEDLKYYGLLIAGYHEKTGEYPLQKKAKKNMENYVYIGTKDQTEFVGKNSFPNLYKIFKYEEFVKDIESVLKVKVRHEFDPQNVPVNAPVFYIYMLKDNDFYFSVHLFDGDKLGKKMDDHYYKVQLSDIDMNEEGIWRLDTLLKNNEFVDRMNDIYIWIPPRNSY